jgi:hypothetical protein
MAVNGEFVERGGRFVVFSRCYSSKSPFRTQKSPKIPSRS